MIGSPHVRSSSFSLRDRRPAFRLRSSFESHANRSLDMYEWRKMSPEERERTLQTRIHKSHPWHSPPHRFSPGIHSYLLSASCYEHRPFIAHSAERLDEFTKQLLETCTLHSQKIYAWCILPNHYHALVQSEDLKALLTEIAKLHGRTSYYWNLEENTA